MPDSEKSVANVADLYDRLRRFARAQMRAERVGHTLSATALVHEAFLKLGFDLRLAQQNGWTDPRLYAAFAEAMRQVLLDHAKARHRQKRGGGRNRAGSDALAGLAGAPSIDPDIFLALDDAVRRLAQHDPQLGELVRLRFFAGLTIAETARALGCSERTVKNGRPRLAGQGAAHGVSMVDVAPASRRCTFWLVWNRLSSRFCDRAGPSSALASA